MKVREDASSRISDSHDPRPIVDLDGVGVRYRLPRGGVRSIKEYLLQTVRGTLRFDDFWALERVHLSVERGERVGIIGRNGAGKSTLLQVIARVLEPTTGTAVVRGRVAPLLQLGAGFDPELSGRENVYLNGALLGMRRSQIRARFDAIVAFAELEAFIDAPLRTYSTGMAARLGFAVAAECQPDLLLLDEVLSVGDEAFQEKCTERLREFTDFGMTMIVVTHNPDFVFRECTRAVWVHDKHIVDDGDPQSVVAAYHRFLQEVSEGGPDPALTPVPEHVFPAAASAEPERDLPIPPLELRALIGQTDPAAFDNPTGRPVFDFVDRALLERHVFELRSGCGRWARQFIQQLPRPERYLGIDPHRGMVAWCKRNLEPAAPGFEFQHHDVYDHTLNRSFGKPRMLPLPAEDGAFTFVEAWSVFPHLTEDQMVFYLREIARILSRGGVFHSTWFLFDKCDGFPMLHDGQNALYASDAEPTAAVTFDRTWLRRQVAAAGLRIHAVWPVRPAPRGFQWHILMSPAADQLPEADWPVDDRPSAMPAAV